ncbi:GNAT family acetyltransferase [Microbacterium hydrocarbonoxydans]|uniref:GNAT family acetyltransferase n=1 Tax=Microbacterium hydrocarbonoxydans TaxID=273678 RepID=UPI0007BB680A|nr:GNAT family acetyltransferase [Microbacterium hydrocarbonoxydans]GAT72882.1 acetyltransferase [Microbacterium sp. HM58-2]
MEIRTFAAGDIDAVIALWKEAGLTRPWNDPRADIDRMRAVWPDLLIVAADGGSIVGSVMAGYDGHRGWLYYLATAAARRGEGIASALVREAEHRLLELGCPKVQLMVRPGNEIVFAFYDRVGYERFDIGMSGKRLIVDSPAEGVA